MAKAQQLIPLKFSAGAVTLETAGKSTVVLDAVPKTAHINAQATSDRSVVFGVSLQQQDGVSMADIQIG